jgi:hypothetical protein
LSAGRFKVVRRPLGRRRARVLARRQKAPIRPWPAHLGIKPLMVRRARRCAKLFMGVRRAGADSEPHRSKHERLLVEQIS